MPRRLLSRLTRVILTTEVYMQVDLSKIKVDWNVNITDIHLRCLIFLCYFTSLRILLCPNGKSVIYTRMFDIRQHLNMTNRQAGTMTMR